MKKTINKLAVLCCFAMLAFASNTYAGCNDPGACNFNAADTDAVDCLFTGTACDDGNAETTGDIVGLDCSCAGFLDGCTNSSACNFNSSATTDDGSCVLPGDPCDDGDITTGSDTVQADCGCAGVPNQGCTDTTACNFDSSAAVNDGTCFYPGDTCDDGDAGTGDDTVQADCSCAGIAQGCTDTTALNFDSGATLDDGSCIVPGCADAPTTWSYCYDSNTDAIVAVFAENNPGEGVTMEFNAGTIEAGWDVITIYDGPNAGSPVLFSGDGDLTGLILQSSGATLSVGILSDGSVSCQTSQPAIDADVYCAAEVLPGCTDSTACNYDSTATFDDATCAFPGDACDDGDAQTTNDAFSAECGCAGELLGCTDTTADNFNSLAIVDDGTCLYNDTCANPEVVSCGSSVSGSTLLATSGSELLAPACGPSIDGPGVWYTITGTGDEITASTCASTYDSRIHVFSGDCTALVCEGGNDDSCGLQSEVTWFGAIGVDYVVHVSGWNGNIGDFVIDFTCAPATCSPPLNDQCGSAFPLTDGVAFAGTNVCSYANDPQPGCDPFASINGVWYTWNSEASNAAIIDFAAAAAPVDSAADAPAVAMYSGSCGNPTELYCEDFNVPVVGVEITGLSINTNYYFLVWTDADESEGEFDLTVTGGVSGCTTEGACNYDSSATIDDGSCDLTCVGCTDPTAVNYSSLATFDDGSCILACESGVTSVFNYCYDVNENTLLTFIATDAAELPTLSFTAGTVEAGWDELYVYDGPDNTGTSLTGGTFVDGDLTGLIFQGTTPGGSITLELITDASVSCQSGSQTEWAADLYCTELLVIGCTDPLATNFDSTANADCAGVLGGTDTSCCEYFGCTDSAACNYDALAQDDDGTCCLDNCTNITITDTFGDGGPTVTLFDSSGAQVASLSLDDGFEISGDFCIPSDCIAVVVTADAFPAESGITITTQNGLEYEEAVGGGVEGGPFNLNLGATGPCDISGCTDPAALNYNEDANLDCAEVEGNADVSCCVYPAENNECDGAIALTSDVEANWDTNGTATLQYDGSDYSCSPTLAVDAWYSYTPSCEATVTITSTSNQGGELGVWTGDCAGGALTLVECGANGGFTAVTIDVVMNAGQTYYIQTGSNSDFGANSVGTILLTEGDCRGCAYSAATNFDPNAVVDNGTCEFESCSCPGDFNDDGLITAADLTGFLAVFGGSCD